MKPSRFALRIALVAVTTLVAVSTSLATSLVPRNLVGLIELSELIVVGDVRAVRDGLDADGVPYTEVEIDVTDSLKGTVASTYAFRQYGLLAPRKLADGRTHLGVSPEGWPRFAEGERVVLFLYERAERTGLRTTVGLYQGKLTVENGLARNAMENANLFRGVEIVTDDLSAAERRLLEVRSGPVDAAALLALVRRAIDEQWIETGVMRHAR